MKVKLIIKEARRLVTENEGMMRTLDLHTKLVEIAKDKRAVDQALVDARKNYVLIHDKGFERLGRDQPE
jgi:hypothetical protein